MGAGYWIAKLNVVKISELSQIKLHIKKEQ